MRVLIVEDEPAISDFLQMSLESEYYAVDTADDGEKGLRFALLNEYDLIILDNQLPNMCGKDVCREIRQAGVNTPIIGLSVLTDTNEKVAFLNAGADDYLAKPFSLEELLARLRALLRRAPEVAEEVLEVKDLALHVKEHKVVRAGEEIKLTRKEFMLLEYLMRNIGIVLSRGMIMEHVWDMNADPFSYTIESHVTSLRRKIKDKDQYLIQTVTGSGYKIGN